MKSIASSFRVSAACLGALALVAGAGKTFAQIPYPDSGTVNPITYSFTAASTGDIDAYFVGFGGAAYSEDLGLLDNGVPIGGEGLNNHTSSAGEMYDFGMVNAGDTLTFYIDVYTGYDYGTGTHLGDVYSNPSLNATYDSTYSSSPGVNHVYAVPYNAASDLLSPLIPSGTYVGFEDLPASNPPDYNYTDEQYVFTDVAVTSSAPDSASTMGLLGIAVAGMGWVRRRLMK